jgi:Sel1 repeat
VDTSNDSTQPPGTEASELERLKFDFDKLSAEQDLLIRQAELRLHAKEVALKEADFQRLKWRDPLFLAITGAVLTAITSIVVTFVQNAQNRRTAEDKLSSDVILEWSKTSDPELRKSNLLFFLDAGIIKDPNGNIRRLVDRNLAPSLPPEKALAAALGDWGRPGADFARDLQNFRIAADHGDGQAMASLGWMYENGFGLPGPDCSAAKDWYQKALDHGYPKAIWNIGRLYDLGCGLPHDPAKARAAYTAAKALGMPEGERDLKALDLKEQRESASPPQ